MPIKHPFQEVHALTPDESVKQQAITERLFVKATDANFKLHATIVKTSGDQQTAEEISLPRPASEFPSGSSPIPVQCLNKLDANLELLYEYVMHAKLAATDVVSIEILGSQHVYEAVLSLINILNKDRPEVTIEVGSYIDTRDIDRVRTQLAIESMEETMALSEKAIATLPETDLVTDEGMEMVDSE